MSFTRGEDPYKALNIGKDRIKEEPWWKKINFPKFKRVTPKLLSTELVSVKPLPKPSFDIYELLAIKYTYDSSAGTIH